MFFEFLKKVGFFVVPFEQSLESISFAQKNKNIPLTNPIALVLGSVADPDPGSGDVLTPGSGIRDGKKSGSRMNIPDHFYDSLETVFRVKNT